MTIFKTHKNRVFNNIVVTLMANNFLSLPLAILSAPNVKIYATFPLNKGKRYAGT